VSKYCSPFLSSFLLLYYSFSNHSVALTYCIVAFCFPQTELTSEVNPTKTHLANMGRMIEDMEYDIRSNMNELYIMKTKEVVNSIHRYGDGPIQKSAFVASLNAAVIGHGAKKEKGVPSILH
jgi:F-actin capping protein, beta subunit